MKVKRTGGALAGEMLIEVLDEDIDERGVFVIPEHITCIDSGVFKGNTKLKRVIGKGIKGIGSDAFSECLLLEDICFPHAQSIGTSAFEGCESLRKVSLLNKFDPDSGLGEKIFSGCTALNTLDLSAYKWIPYILIGEKQHLDKLILSGKSTVDSNPIYIDDGLNIEIVEYSDKMPTNPLGLNQRRYTIVDPNKAIDCIGVDDHVFQIEQTIKINPWIRLFCGKTIAGEINCPYGMAYGEYEDYYSYKLYTSIENFRKDMNDDFRLEGESENIV